ncbi:MAG TPA: hypothetical protein VHT91_43980 [Kofleriaceae bacterium]|nr:hypothetical protein [Kofleriaceae bacterium]
MNPPAPGLAGLNARIFTDVDADARGADPEVPPIDDPEILARRKQILQVLLRMDPEEQQQLRHEGRLTEARAALRRVLARRQLMASKDDDTRIEACTDIPTLERWLDQAITAVTVSGAMA